MRGTSRATKAGRGQRLIGLVLLVICGAATAVIWHWAMTQGQYSRAAAALLPALAIIGLGLALFPIDFERIQSEVTLREDRLFPEVPIAWQYILLAAVLAGLGNWYAIALTL